jgi:hypothetical protein
MLKSVGTIVIVLVAGVSLSLAFACGDGGGGGASNEATDLCEGFCDVADQIGDCEDFYDDNCQKDSAGEECEVLALEKCGAL